jgi:hypothetical protein
MKSNQSDRRSNRPHRLLRCTLVSMMLGTALPAFAQPTRIAPPAAAAATNETPPATPDPPEPPDSREPGANSGPVGKLPPLEFYRGPVIAESIVGIVDLALGQAPKASLQVTLGNRSARGEQISLGFRGGPPVPVALPPGGRAMVTLTPPASHVGKGDAPQIVRLDLVLVANGAPLGTPPERVDVQVRLPPGVRSLLRASQPLKAGDPDPAGGGVYRLSASRTFMPELALVYTGGPVSLSIDKNIDPGAIRGAGPVTVMLTVQNRGPGDAKNIVVSDNFDPRDFDGAGEGFELVTGKENDSRLLFKRELPFLGAGQTQTIAVSLKAKGAVGAASLSAATAAIDGAVVGISNKIVLPEVQAGAK